MSLVEGKLSIDPLHRGFDGITLLARNITENGEEMEKGKLTFVGRYRMPGETSYRYVSEDICTDCSVPADAPAEFVADISDSPVPLEASEISLYLVYRGKLGTEEDAVAVGFSDSLRTGMTEISLSDTGTYGVISDPDSITDPAGEGFDRITFLVGGGPSADGAMNGNLTFVAKYRISQADPFRNPVSATSDEFYSVTEDIGSMRISPDSPGKVEAGLGGGGIPLWATDLYIYVICRASSESEPEKEFVTVGFRDISEPTPIDIRNVTDKICLFGETVEAGSGTAVSIIDSPDSGGDGDGRPDEWDIFPHRIEDVHARFSRTDDPRRAEGNSDREYLIPKIEPGGYFRFFILSDRRCNFSCVYRRTRTAADDIYHSHYNGFYTYFSGYEWKTLTNQHRPDGRETESMREFRETSYWRMLWIHTAEYQSGGRKCRRDAYDTDGN